MECMSERGIPTDKQPWRLLAACRSLNKDEITEKDSLFFLGKGGKANRAKEQCAICPVQRNCLAFALYYKEEEGIWGGMTPDERRDIPEFVKDLMMLEAGSLIYVQEERDMEKWLPIIFPNQRQVVDPSELPDIF